MKFKPAQLFAAAVPIVVGLVIYNSARQVAGNTVVGKVLDGSIFRRA